jgi:hypothetical protein
MTVSHTRFEELKSIHPHEPVPVKPDAPDEKRHKRARKCPHTRKHHTAAGGCRKCDRNKPVITKRFRRFT